MTYTKTYTRISFANPYLRCDECSELVAAMRSDTHANLPCGHLGVTSACPSWSPVDGCTCGRPHWCCAAGEVASPEPCPWHGVGEGKQP